jgi:uncharacterized protein YabE (DUF348 family)
MRMLVTGLAGIVLLGGSGAWATTDRTVTVTVDGEPRTLHTHARVVSRVLSHAGVELGPHDVVEPHLTEPVDDGAQVLVDRGRLVTAVVDGRVRQFWTTARSVQDALTDLGMRQGRLQVSASRSTRLPLSGMRFEVRTEKQVVLDVHRDRRAVTTYAATVAELLAQQAVPMAAGDESEPVGSALLRDGVVVTVARIERKVRTETVTVPAPERKEKDPALMLDQISVTDPGRAGTEVREVEYTYADGLLRDKRVLSSSTTVEPRTRVVVSGGTPYPADDTGANWAALANCESHSNPHAVSANGTYHGLYQFSVDTWRRMGGTGIPSEATPREQTYRAILLYKRSGRGQWPVCGKFL